MIKEVKITELVEIKSNLAHIMIDKQIHSITDLMIKTGVGRESLNRIYHSKSLKGVQLETLLKICKAIDCKLDDLLMY